MDKNKIKFKYILGLWKMMPSYPTKEDIVYELSLFLFKDKRPGGEFSQQTFNSVFGSSWEKSKHGDLIKEMIESGEFEEVKKNPSVKNKQWYKIKNNPY